MNGFELDEVNGTEMELLEDIERRDWPSKLKTRITNRVRNFFRLQRALMYLEQLIERKKRK